MCRADLSASAELLVLYYDVEVHSLDYATAYCEVSIVPMAICFNGENSPSVHTDDKFFIIYYFFLHFTIVQQINGALGLYKASMFNF